MIIEIAIGAGSALALLALFARLGDQALVEVGFIGLAAMLAIYVGAELVTGSLTDIVVEMMLAIGVTVLARIALVRWKPGIGVLILLHGGYDALFGPAKGVAEWYPPLCAGFDVVFGIGLLVLLHRRHSTTQ